MDFFDDFGRPRPTGDAKRKAVDAILARAPQFAPVPPSDVALRRDVKAEAKHDFAWGISLEPEAVAHRLGLVTQSNLTGDDDAR